MGLMDYLKTQFLEIIQWQDDSRDTLSFRFTDEDKEIKRGAQLIVRESQVAQFVYLGQFGDTFGPGKHTLNTDNIPLLTTLKSWKYGFESPFKADVYYVVTRLFTGNKWGTANPIMLHIETPYGIYETVDWVAQAQLCTLVGPEKFLYLKQYYVRTVFDLERALLGPDAESKFKKLILSILMSDDDRRRLIEGKTGIARLPTFVGDLAKREAEALQAGAGADTPAQPELSPHIDQLVPIWMDDQFTAHLVNVLVDDLHVRRLRQIWNHIVDRLGKDSDSLRPRSLGQ